MKKHTGSALAALLTLIGCNGPNLDAPGIIFKCVADADCADGQTCDVATGACAAGEGEGEGVGEGEGEGEGGFIGCLVQ